MAFKTFAPGVLTSSDVNTFLMRQAVITCTSSTRPASPNEGMLIYETDTDSLQIYSGAVWDDASSFASKGFKVYTPTLGGTGWAIGNGTLTGEFFELGKLCIFGIMLIYGSTSTAGTSDAVYPTLTLPVTTSASDPLNLVSALATDVSTGQANQTLWEINAATTIQGITLVSANSGNPVTLASIRNNRPFTWATGDNLILSGFYRTG